MPSRAALAITHVQGIHHGDGFLATCRSRAHQNGGYRLVAITFVGGMTEVVVAPHKEGAVLTIGYGKSAASCAKRNLRFLFGHFIIQDRSHIIKEVIGFRVTSLQHFVKFVVGRYN